MIQRTAFPSTLTDLPGRLAGKAAGSAQPGTKSSPAGSASSPGRIRLGWNRARAFLRLPGDLRSFTLFVAAVGIVSSGMALHILLSAQILAARVELRTIKLDYDATMRQNADLVWQIAAAKSLPAVVARAEELGYRASTDPQYVVRVASPDAGADPSAGAAQEQSRGGASLARQPVSSASQPAQGNGANDWRAWLPGAPAGDADSQLSFPGRWLEMLRSRSSP